MFSRAAGHLLIYLSIYLSRRRRSMFVCADAHLLLLYTHTLHPPLLPLHFNKGTDPPPPSLFTSIKEQTPHPLSLFTSIKEQTTPHGPLSHYCRKGKTFMVRTLKKNFFYVCLPLADTGFCPPPLNMYERIFLDCSPKLFKKF